MAARHRVGADEPRSSANHECLFLIEAALRDAPHPEYDFAA
jgi:hypothetical protein